MEIELDRTQLLGSKFRIFRVFNGDFILLFGFGKTDMGLEGVQHWIFIDLSLVYWKFII